MKVIYKEKGKGKTIDLIKLAAKDFKYIVCRDRKTALTIFETARKMNLEIPLPITYQEILDKEFLLKTFIKSFLIDDIEDFLEIMFLRSGKIIEAITITKFED